MSFKPSEITSFHVREGIKKINTLNKSLRNGTRWEVIVDGISYPPKEIMRYAREQYDGNSDWPRGGGPATNNFLEKMGFEIREIKESSVKSNYSYFKLPEIWDYQKVAGTKYNSSTREAKWYYDTRGKLYFLISLLSEYLSEEFELVYHEKPNAQKGRGKILFKDYVLAGFAPKENSVGDHLFIKISFTNLKLKPHFAIDLDMNFKDGKSKFHKDRKKIYSNSLIEWEINDGFPDNWDKLLELIIPEITRLNQEFKNLIQTNLKPTKMADVPLNQILYGPPGTGKTYNTINKAISIINPSFNLNVDRDVVKQEYDRLLELGYIMFTTFHQSMNYEDFIEGIKPETTQGNVTYDVKDGIFKELCDDAKNIYDRSEIRNENSLLTSKEFEKHLFYKLSLGNSNDKNDREIYEFCIENNCIALGYGGMIDYSGKSTKEIYKAWQTLHPDDSTTPSYVNYFVNIITNNDYVIISNGNRKIRAMAKVIGDYYIDLEAPIRYKHFRKVEWVFYNQEILSSEVYELNLSQSTLYQFKKLKLKRDFFIEKKIGENNQQLNNFVLIIDEINRGNVSSIFGELITLIEEDKRIGSSNELTVKLPYSKNEFGVPANLYIIGTMNTADRSVEALDTALRRRFSFEEMPPKYNLAGLQNSIYNFQAFEIIETINKRIEKLLDRDHTIGHSYFLNRNEDSLIDTFYRCVIPLLQEYFFGDYEKIGLILGKGFVELDKSTDTTDVFADFDSESAPDYSDKLIYRIIDHKNNKEAFSMALSQLMNKKVEKA